MKGIIIYGNPMWGDNERATYCELINEASFKLIQAPKEIISHLEGEASESSKAVCSKDDTYDFETGALIALMKMCGVEKVKKAAKETFFDVTENSVNEYEEKIQALEKEIKRLTNVSDGFYKFNGRLINEIDQKNHEIISLKALKLTNESLKKENNHLKYVKSCNESTIESLENTRDLLINKNNELKKKYDEVFESDKYAKSEVGRLSIVNHRLEEEIEKLQHGYNDMIFCGGRQNGKQFKTLVELFKKTPKDKVDAAYKEAYNTTLPVWQKEVFNQMYGVYKESKEKPEPPRTLDINGTTYRKTIQLKDYSKDQLDSLIEGSRAFTRKCVDEWLYKIPTKREEMWEKILELHKENDVVIEVKKEDITTFLHEIENKIPEITWVSGDKIFETKYTIGDIYKELETHDMIYFRLWKKSILSYSSDSHIYPYRELKCIDYLPPMRWDLFKKGRIVVGLRKEHYDEFILNATKHIDSFNKHKPYNDFNYSFFIYNKDAKFIEAIGRSQFRAIKEMNNHKVVYWEDVRDNTSTMEDPYNSWSL